MTDRRGESGFTVMEMVVALTIMSFSLMTLATVQFSALKALGASRQRSAFVELSNAALEQLRSMPDTKVGVAADDPDLATAYVSGHLHKGFEAVILPAGSGAPPAVERVTTSPVKGIVVPYTIRRWVTWDPTGGGNGQDLRRLEIRIEWSENHRSARDLSLSSVWYPGGLGSDTSTNNPPMIASATVTPATGGFTTTVLTYAASASDPDGDGLIFSWQFGDGATGSGSTTTHKYSTAGSYSILLVVRDTRGGQATAVLSADVAVFTNRAPTAQFVIVGPNNGNAPFTVNVSGAASSDPDGDTLTYTWDWGDGATGTGVNAGHMYTAAGPYSIRLTVADPSGATSTSAPASVNVGGGCGILGASFKNPGTNAVGNDIKVISNSNSKPLNPQFVFSATTNQYCSSVKWSLQTVNANNRYEVTGTSATVANGLKTWTVTSTIPNGAQFPLGALLTGFATAPGGANFPFQFSAHV